MLTMSAAPPSASSAIDSQKSLETANATVSTPNSAVATSKVGPALRSGGRDASAGPSVSPVPAGTMLDSTTYVIPQAGAVVAAEAVDTGGTALAGTLGAISRDTSLGAVTNPPIQSYSAPDPATGGTTTSITAIVDYINSLPVGDTSFVLNDATGNVGAVAGIAGHVKTVNGVPQPARDGVNGSVVTLSASSIMSIVAGSVDSVAPVQLLSGITVTNRDGVLGADKSPNAPFGPNGVLDYYNPATGQDVQNLAAGYKLIDGAIFAVTIVQPVEAPFITGPRVF